MKHLLKYILLFILILGISAFIQHYITQQIDIFYHTWQIYLFHIIATILILCIVYFVNKQEAVYTGYSFLAGTMLQMLACIVFLIPLLGSEKQDKIPDVLSFFIPYFICLIFATFYAIKVLNKK